MGNAEKKSMLYLEARCLLVIKGAGVQGTQNGSISCIAMSGAVPSGIREVLAENVMAAMLGLDTELPTVEEAQADPATTSPSPIRTSAAPPVC